MPYALVRPPQRRTRGQRRGALRQSAQRPRPERSSSSPRPSWRAAAWTARSTSWRATISPSRTTGRACRRPARGASRSPTGCASATTPHRSTTSSATGDTARHELPLPDRRRGDQGQRLRRAAPAGIHGQGPEMGRSLQIQGRTGAHAYRQHLFPGRTHPGPSPPVANLEPVLLAGTTVRRATLHNAEQMALLDIRPGDMVYVEKGR